MADDTKLVGDISEMMVCLELLKRNLRVLKPIGDRLPYDLAVDVGNSKIARLQVKTAYFVEELNGWKREVYASKTNRKLYKKAKYDMSNVEFFVFVIRERNEFYIIPSEVVSKYESCISFIPHRDRNRDVHEIESYLNAWNLIK